MCSRVSSPIVRALGLAVAVGTVWAASASGQLNGIPRIVPIPDISVAPGAVLELPVHADDPDGEPITFSLNLPPAFVSITATGSNDAVVRLAPAPENAGSAVLTVVALDPLEAVDWESFTATVPPPPGFPIAYAGGPYLDELQLDGTRSFDPEGSALTYLWDFGGGRFASGPTPSLPEPMGSYFITLTVTDTEGHSSTGTTYAVHTLGLNPVSATPDTRRPFLQIPGGPPTFCIQIQQYPWGSYFDPRYVDLSTVALGAQGYFGPWLGPIPAIAEKTSLVGDTDHDGFPEIRACFRASDLEAMFESAPPGRGMYRFLVKGHAEPVGGFSGWFDFVVHISERRLAARATPHPSQGRAARIEFVTSSAGPARLELFDVRGRLLAVLLDEPNLSAGSHSVPVEPKGGWKAESAGVFLFRLLAGTEIATGKVVITR